MMTIGELARLSGLTAKALRHYDERGVLVPAAVDPATGYRSYAGGQVRDAVLVKALRDAGVPVERVRGALADPAGVPALLAAFRAEVAAARAAQDAALAAADRTVAALAAPIAVVERDAPAQHYAGIVQELAVDADEDAAVARANAAYAALHGALTAAGTPPSGPFWSTLAEGRTPGTVDLTLCWPTATPPPPDLAVDGAVVVTGTLPARRELVAEVGDPPPTGPHPALLALLAALDRRPGGPPRSAAVRQSPRELTVML